MLSDQLYPVSGRLLVHGIAMFHGLSSSSHDAKEQSFQGGSIPRTDESSAAASTDSSAAAEALDPPSNSALDPTQDAQHTARSTQNPESSSVAVCAPDVTPVQHSPPARFTIVKQSQVRFQNRQEGVFFVCVLMQLYI